MENAFIVIICQTIVINFALLLSAQFHTQSHKYESIAVLGWLSNNNCSDAKIRPSASLNWVVTWNAWKQTFYHTVV